jgi:hypothetical protein
MYSSFIFKLSVGSNNYIMYTDNLKNEKGIISLKNVVYQEDLSFVEETLTIHSVYINYIETSTKEEYLKYKETIEKYQKRVYN